MRFFHSGTFVVFTGRFFYFFHAHILRFHGWVLAENFTGTVDFSRAVSNNFSREGFFFSRAEIQKISRERIFFFTGKKKTLIPSTKQQKRGIQRQERNSKLLRNTTEICQQSTENKGERSTLKRQANLIKD